MKTTLWRGFHTSRLPRLRGRGRVPGWTAAGVVACVAVYSTGTRLPNQFPSSVLAAWATVTR